MTIYILCYVLCGIIAVQSLLHRLERKDLYNRIMSKNLTEYKTNSDGKGKKTMMSAHEKAIRKWRSKGGEG